MCGRYSESRPPGEIRKVLDVAVSEDTSFQPRFNIAPTQPAPVILAENGGLCWRELRWGLIPAWAREPGIGSKLINARSETAASKPSFRSAFKRRRCLVVADGFYEWQRTGGAKTPYRFVPVDDGFFLFAGLWETWAPPDADEVRQPGLSLGDAGDPAQRSAPLRTFTILTTSANDAVVPVHDRMPVILQPDKALAWLDPETKPESLQALLQPCPAGGMRKYAVSPWVNNPRHEDARCMEPV